MNISIIAIGDELLLGQVTDTNSGEIARLIDPYGWRVSDVRVIADRPSDIRRAVDDAFKFSDVVLTTGGLGPTKDDLTKETLRSIFGGEMALDEATLQNVKEVVSRRGISLNELTAAQAVVPTSCQVIQNKVGTAPIMWFERDGKVLVAMPGVPFETRQMFASEVFPRLLERFPSSSVLMHTNTIVTGMTESEVATALQQIESELPQGIHLAYLPKPALIRLRLDGVGSDRESTKKSLELATAQIRSRLGRHVIAVSDLTIGEIVLDVMSKKGLTLATAESCTGGNIAHVITSVAGSSRYFKGGVVAYSNEVKTGLLNVSESTLAANGAVSESVVAEMVVGATKALGADCAVATSGIAGPGGAVEGKPVGTVCIAVKTPNGVKATTRRFPGSRDRVIERATTEALTMLVLNLMDDEK